MLARQRGKRCGGAVSGAIVHIINTELMRQRIDDLANSGVGLFDDTRFIEDRDDKVNIQLVFFRGHTQ